MALCLTDRQNEILAFYQKYFKKHGVFPNTAEAARHLKAQSAGINAAVGALFLKGAFTDGKPLTANYRGLHATGGKAQGMKVKVGRTYSAEAREKMRESGRRTQALLRARKAGAKPAASPDLSNVDRLMAEAIRRYFADMATGKGATLNE